MDWLAGVSCRGYFAFLLLICPQMVMIVDAASMFLFTTLK